jgi:hypothetical protein
MKLPFSRIAPDRGFSSIFRASLPALCHSWVALAVIVAVFRGALSIHHASPLHSVLLAGALAAPAAALLLVLNYFRGDRLVGQPYFRLAQLGRWRSLSEIECQTLEAYGTAGLLTMLLGGLLLNIPFRAFEFLAAMPTPLTHSPSWYLLLYGLMLTDLTLLCTCYAVLVGLALRRVPQFPRLLAATWLLDVTMQMLMQTIMRTMPGFPDAVEKQLAALLTGNMHKVAISMVIWLPYLLLSPRINLTFRHRVPARALQNSRRN